MQSNPRQPTPVPLRAACSRRRPNPHGFIYCSYCGYPVAFSVNWAQQKACQSCGYKFPDLLYPPITASAPTRPAIQPCSAALGGILPITPAATPRPTRPSPPPGRCPRRTGSPSPVSVFEQFRVKTPGRAAIRTATVRASAMPALLWGGTAYGLAGVFGRVYTANAADLSGFEWAAAVVVAAIVFAHLAKQSLRVP